MLEFSQTLSEIPGVLYCHDLYQSTMVAIEAALNLPYVLMTLPTNGGKTMAIGMTGQHYTKNKGKTVIVVVPNEQLKIQMRNQFGRMGRGLKIMTRLE